MDLLEQLNVKRLEAVGEYNKVYKEHTEAGGFDMSLLVPYSNRADSALAAWLTELNRVKGYCDEGL
jgi:hypothetical protein